MAPKNNTNCKMFNVLMLGIFEEFQFENSVEQASWCH